MMRGSYTAALKAFTRATEVCIMGRKRWGGGISVEQCCEINAQLYRWSDILLKA